MQSLFLCRTNRTNIQSGGRPEDNMSLDFVDTRDVAPNMRNGVLKVYRPTTPFSLNDTLLGIEANMGCSHLGRERKNMMCTDSCSVYVT